MIYFLHRLRDGTYIVENLKEWAVDSARCGHLLNLKCVLYEGIDPNYSDHLNISLTAYAVRGGHLKCLKYLFQKGAILSNTLLDDAVMFKKLGV